MSVPASNGSNASDLGLIVQGVLIFLSAIVGIVGYVVQSKLSQRAKTREEELARKEHGRQLKLQRVRQQMNDFVGPAVALTSTHQRYLNRFCSQVLSPGENLKFNDLLKRHFFVSGGLLSITTELYMKGNYVLSKENEIEIRKDITNGQLAKEYRQFVRNMLDNYLIPLSDLIEKKGISLAELPGRKAFLDKYPGYESNHRPRELIFQEVIMFTREFQTIVKYEWDNGIFDTLAPKAVFFPMNIQTYLESQLDVLRRQEMEYSSGILQHDTVTAEEENARFVALQSKDWSKSMYNSSTNKNNNA